MNGLQVESAGDFIVYNSEEDRTFPVDFLSVFQGLSVDAFKQDISF